MPIHRPLPEGISIAVDIDGVLTEHPRPLAKAASAHFGIELPESAFVDSAGLNVPLAVREWVYSPDGPASRLTPAPGAQAFLQKLVDLLGNDHVRIVTARNAASAAMTFAWFSQHGFPSVEIIFGDDKAAIATTTGCTLAVEDSERHARNYAAAGISCFLLGGDHLGHLAGVEAVNDFDDIIAVIEDVLSELANPEVRHSIEDRPRPTVVISDQIHPIARDIFNRHADLIDVDGTDLDALLAVLPRADALVVRSETQVTAEVLAAGPKLRVVTRAGVGVDNIDLVAATHAGVLVLNAPGANAVSAGEHTIALLLAVTRQLPFANASTHSGHWERKKIKPIDLNGRTVGIVGLGRVGSVVAKRLKAFDMNVIAHDPHISEARFAELGVTPVDYLTLLATSDVVTFHCPSTEETRHILNADALTYLKPHAIVLNVARGEVVDQNALAEALISGQIAAAGVDVFPHEPCTSSPLFGLPNVVLTPHTGGSSAEALRAVGEMISTTTIAALNGNAVPNAVNLPPASLNAPALQRLTTVAGAAGHLLSVLSPQHPGAIRFTTRGFVAPDIIEHVLSSAVAESVQRWLGRRVTPVNARLVAAEAGIEVIAISGTPDPALDASFTIETVGQPHHVVRFGWDGDVAGIIEVDRFSLERALAGEVLITHHRDVPGIIGRIGTILGRHDVNIAGMQVGRHNRGGEAMMVLNVDDEMPAGALEEIMAVAGIINAYRVSLPSAQTRAGSALASVGL